MHPVLLRRREHRGFGLPRALSKMRIGATLALAAALSLGLASVVHAQGRGGAPGASPPAAKQSAPVDLTGYWVAVVTEDWHYRMVTPARGDYAGIPINPASKKAADLWDPATTPARDEAAGEQCKSYGAPALMRVPERLHITWQDDNTLKVETDAGEQIRLFHFGDRSARAGAPTWQGDSVARWESGDMKVVTANLRPGYLRKNGVPYSDKTTLTEYWDLSVEHYLAEPHKDEQWLVITSIVDDPVYLQSPWLTGLHFKREADGSKWDPQPCSAKW